MAYYRSKEGRIKKRALNRKRYLLTDNGCNKPAKDEDTDKAQESVPPILEHVRMVSSLIEGYEVSIEAIRQMLKKKQRQHSLWKGGRFDYLVEQLNKDPPLR